MIAFVEGGKVAAREARSSFWKVVRGTKGFGFVRSWNLEKQGLVGENLVGEGKTKVFVAVGDLGRSSVMYRRVSAVRISGRGFCKHLKLDSDGTTRLGREC